MCSLYFLPVFGPDVLDDVKCAVNKFLDASIVLADGRVDFLRLFEEQFLQYVEFLPYILAKAIQCIHQYGSVAHVFVEVDEFLETFCVGVHLRNFVHEMILSVDCLIHQNHLDSVLFQSSCLEAGQVAVRHG